MKILAKDLQIGSRIQLADQICTITEKEISDIGKHGKRKVRIVAANSSGEKIIIVRPDDYPFNVI